eukprot:EG_transcript_36880
MTLGGDDVYAIEKSRPGLQSTQGPRCDHSSAAFRIVTRTFPAFIVACGATEAAVMEDFAALQGHPHLSSPHEDGVVGRFLHPSGSGRQLLKSSLPHFHGISFQAPCAEAMLAHTAAHESAVAHAFFRLGGYLRALGCPQAANG